MTVETLRQVPLFESLDDASAGELCDLIETLDCPAHQVLFHAGDVGDAMYLIERGKVRICVQAKDGHEVTLANLGRGDFFGEMALLDGERRSADAVVAEDARLALLSREHFLSFMRSNPNVALEMLTALANRLRHTDELLRHSATRNVNVEEAAQLTLADRAADIIAEFGGSWKFILAAVFFFNLWILINSWLLGDKGLRPLSLSAVEHCDEHACRSPGADHFDVAEPAVSQGPASRRNRLSSELEERAGVE